MITIIISAHNEERSIEGLLLDLKKELPKISEKFEIILSLSGCTDKTKEVAENITRKEKLPIKIIETPLGKINSQIYTLKKVNKKSLGFIFLDADIKMKENAIVNIIEDAKKHRNVMMFYSVGIPVKRKEIFYNIINVRTLNPQYVVAKEDVTEFHPYEKNKRKKVFATGGIYLLQKNIYDVDKKAIGDDSYLTHSIYYRFGKGSIKETEDSFFVYQPVRTFSSWIAKWRRIWRDVNNLYKIHPEFEYLKKYMQLKIDFNRLWKERKIRLIIFFFLERCWNFFGYKIFKLFHLNDKSKYWKPLEDTKRF